MNLPDLQVNPVTIAVLILAIILQCVVLYRVRREHKEVIQEYKVRHRQNRALSGMNYNYLMILYAYHLLPLYNQRVSAGVNQTDIYEEILHTLMRISNSLYRVTLNKVRDPYVTPLTTEDEEAHWIAHRVMENLHFLRENHSQL